MIEREDLFGKKCRIEILLPGFPDYLTYRIIASGKISKEWVEVPIERSVIVKHDHDEEVAFVIWDGYVDDESTILRVPLKDIEILDD